MVVPVLVVPEPVEVDVEVNEDVDADEPDGPEVEDTPPTPPPPPVPDEVAAAEPDVFDGVVDPIPDPDPEVADPVLVALTGGILIGTLADEHTEVTALETEDWSDTSHALCTQGVIEPTRPGAAQWQVKFVMPEQPSCWKADRKQFSYVRC